MLSGSRAAPARRNLVSDRGIRWGLLYELAALPSAGPCLIRPLRRYFLAMRGRLALVPGGGAA